MIGVDADMVVADGADVEAVERVDCVDRFDAAVDIDGVAVDDDAEDGCIGVSADVGAAEADDCGWCW